MDGMSIVMAIVTSLIASVVFYIFFQYIPEKKKYNSIRPRIEVELMEIADSVFFYLEFPFRYDLHFNSLFQNEINDGVLNTKDFEIGLYNKCLNETYLFDENADKLIVIGKKLQNQADQISNKINQVLLNQQYLTAEEILIVEDINRLLHTYLYDWNAFDKIGGITVHPINPTLSYMSENFNKIYILWLELRRSMYKYTLIRKEKRQGNQRFFSLQLKYLNDLINQKDFEHAVKVIKQLYKEPLSASQRTILEYCLLRIDTEKGNIGQAKERLEILLKEENREKLVHMRGSLECVRENEELMKTCAALCSPEEIAYWDRTVAQEKAIKDSFIQQNAFLMDYYKNKEKNQPPIFDS